MNFKKKIIKISKFLILIINKFLSIFRLTIVPLHYYTPLTELKIIPDHKLLEKADFSLINYNQSESLLFLNNLEKQIKYFSKLDHFKIGQLKKYGKGYGYLESIILQSMIAKIKPTKIIEIGSGVSTFCMLSALKDLNYEFEMLIVDPFISEQLEKLVSKNIYKAFEDQINLRSKKNEELEITVISVKNPEIKSVSLERKHIAYFKLLFESEQVQITKNSKGEIIDGDNNQILQIREIWTFSKNLRSNDPNWILEEIEEN